MLVDCCVPSRRRIKSLVQRFGPFANVLAWPSLLLGMPGYWLDRRAFLAAGVETARWKDAHPALLDKGKTAGGASGHYFHQDLWAARRIFQRNPSIHVDIGSRIDGFVAHVASFRPIVFLDLRRLPAVPNLKPMIGTLLQLPFADRTVPSLSCLHVVEHIGLGRYGDPIQPNGHLAAMRELARVAGGDLYIGVPIGRERVCFNAHRVLAPETILHAFAELELVSQAVVDDHGDLHDGADVRRFGTAEYACGLFHFHRR